jgi:hypothetical protein
VWKLTTTVAKHYTHTTEMKKCKFIKNKVVEHIVKTSVESHIDPPHPCHPWIYDSNEINHA